ncbi:similar to PTEN 2 [Actinidia rufa]|uniref:Similar to PTEN 2 n=1 Tax=Actinidia rufa TaxID=165716 RepID=A0A7J0DRJ0_9ERIC|nr:similar to PTEN 2 [Actinidia rufa]
MDLGSSHSSIPQPVKSPDAQAPTAEDSRPDNSARDAPSKLSASGISTWAKSLKIPQPFVGTQDESPSGNAGKSTFARFTGGLGLRLSPKASQPDDNPDVASPTAQPGFIGTLTTGLVDSSKSAVKAVQVKARHVVSQNKRRYQEGGFDLDMTYITENIIAMGFPAGDMSSGFFGYVEGFYRNHMEEVIKFFETHHKDKYKVYNLCSERLYDASLFEGKVASFPFDDHNCPPIQLIISFCHSAYSWLKEDIENVVVVHCKAGMARTGLMISSLLLYLKFFPTAEESIDYYNQKRCIDGKGLVLPSQIKYVKYFERVLTYFNGENQPGRRCMLRGFRLHRCPYWIRPSITVSDHNEKTLNTGDLDGFDKRKLPSPGFQVEVVLVDYNGTVPTRPPTEPDTNKSVESSGATPTPVDENASMTNLNKDSDRNEKDDVFSDSEDEETGPSKSRQSKAASEAGGTVDTKTSNSETTNSSHIAGLTCETEQVSLGKTSSTQTSEPRKDAIGGTMSGLEVPNPKGEVSDFKAMAADASVFTFGDEDDFEKSIMYHSSTPSSAYPKMSITGVQGQLLELTVVGCNKLKDTEWISRQDPYVCLDYGSTKYRTRTCTDGGKNPTFQEKFTFTLIEGLQELGLVVWNSNTVNYDDFIGSGKVRLQKVLFEGYDDSSWPLVTKTGRSAGEVRLIMHYANAKAHKPAKSHTPSAPHYVGPSVPHGHLHSTPPPASAASYPSLTAAYPTPLPYTSYPHPPHSSAYPPAPYHPPPQPSAYPPHYPPTSAYPPQPYPPPPQAPSNYPPSPFPGLYPPPY